MLDERDIHQSTLEAQGHMHHMQALIDHRYKAPSRELKRAKIICQTCKRAAVTGCRQMLMDCAFRKATLKQWSATSAHSLADGCWICRKNRTTRQTMCSRVTDGRIRPAPPPPTSSCFAANEMHATATSCSIALGSPWEHTNGFGVTVRQGQLKGMPVHTCATLRKRSR